MPPRMGRPFISVRPITGIMALGITTIIILILIITIMEAMVTAGIGN